jgi:large subunit ribosomal protein L30
MSQIRITQERSGIRCLKRHKRTLEALGLRHPYHSVVHNDTPQIRGMVAQVSYLVRVDEAPAAEGEPGQAAPARRKAAKPRRRAAAGLKRAAARKTKRAASKSKRASSRKAAE